MDSSTALRVTHLGGTRWRVETIREGDPNGTPHLVTIDRHFSLRKGKTLRHAVYWQPLPVEGDADLTCYQPVAARFLDFGVREDLT